MKSIATTWSLALTLLSSVGAASAQAPGLSEPVAGPKITAQTTVETETKWYGYQVVLADLALLGVALGSESDELGGLFLFTGPLIHALNGRPAAALTSGAVRLGVPLVTLAGAAIACDNADADDIFCGVDGAVAGALIGVSAMAIIDYGFLSRKKVRREVRVLPTASMSASGDFQVGLGGRF